MGAVDMEAAAAEEDMIDMGVAVVEAEGMGEVNPFETMCLKSKLNAPGPCRKSPSVMPVVQCC